MKKLIFVFGVLLTFTACTDQNANTASNEAPTIEGLKASIKEMDDSLKVLMDEAVKSPEYKMNRVAYHEAINRNKRSEEHTSELQSRPHLVCRLLLEKKNNQEQ